MDIIGWLAADAGSFELVDQSVDDEIRLRASGGRYDLDGVDEWCWVEDDIGAITIFVVRGAGRVGLVGVEGVESCVGAAGDGTLGVVGGVGGGEAWDVGVAAGDGGGGGAGRR